LKIPIVEAIVEDVKIEGNKKTKTYVIRRELSLQKGKPFSTSALSKDYSRLDRLGIFETIDERTDAGTEFGKVVPHWTVKERRTGQVSLGIGYSAREKLVGRAELAETIIRGPGEGVNYSRAYGCIIRTNSCMLW